MGVQNVYNKVVITTESKSFYFDLHNDADNNLKRVTDSIIKHNELLAQHTIKSAIRQLLSTYKPGNNIHEHGKL